MTYRQTSCVIILLAFIAGAARAQITGEVIYNGPAPKLKEINMAAIPAVARMHDGPVKEETIVVGPKNELKNAVVFIDGQNLGGKIPQETVVLDQRGAMYVPHVVAMMVGQKFEIRNSDDFLHNIHGINQKNNNGDQFNFPQQGRAVNDMTNRANHVAEVYLIKCDVHPWMRTWIHVFDHPYFAVTGADGKFSIDAGGLKNGAYTLTTWTEKLGTQKANIIVKNGVAEPVKFEFKP